MLALFGSLGTAASCRPPRPGLVPSASQPSPCSGFLPELRCPACHPCRYPSAVSSGASCGRQYSSRPVCSRDRSKHCRITSLARTNGWVCLPDARSYQPVTPADVETTRGINSLSCMSVQSCLLYFYSLPNASVCDFHSGCLSFNLSSASVCDVKFV